MRTIILLLATWVGWQIFKRWYNNSLLESEFSAQLQKSPLSMMKDGGKMVRCDYCGTHIPLREAAHSKIGSYCCEEHKILGKELSS